MTWKIKDEFINLAAGTHTKVLHNPDTGAEHHLVHLFHLQACPTCGHANPASHVDFTQYTKEMLETLNHHHQKTMAYREKHPHVRIGTEPK